MTTIRARNYEHTSCALILEIAAKYCLPWLVVMPAREEGGQVVGGRALARVTVPEHTSQCQLATAAVTLCYEVERVTLAIMGKGRPCYHRKESPLLS